MTLRKHQREIVEVCREILAGEPIREIILSVTPGGGKSFVPVIIADNLIPVIAEKICWVVPRNSLKYQGEAEFSDQRWNTSKRIRAADNGDNLSRGFAGYVTTYQAVGADPDCHAAEFKKHKYILFLDEFHHVAEGSEWHRAIAPLVDSAALVIKASGTLSRGDGEKIAFLHYAGDEPLLNNLTTRRVITYSRSAAIADGAILPAKFELVDGDAEWEELDGHRNTSALSGEESAKALFTALRTEFADHLLNRAMSEWSRITHSYQAAKLLVVAPNIEIAKTYFAYIARWGLQTRIATSEDTPQARKNIEDFKRGAYHILVTVAMAYEGLNVPEISVICCLSHIRSVPWLEQCFARANRITPGKDNAVVFAPADWAFKKAIKMIEREQLVPLENPEGQQELLIAGERREGGGEARPWIIPVSSKAETRVFTNPSRPWTPIEDAPAPPDLPPWCPPSEAEKILRKNIYGVVTAFLDRQVPGNKLAQSKMLYRRMRLVCEKPVAEMNVRELERVWLWVRREYGLGNNTRSHA
jgi:superfamily II DNA or RNA helicase